MADCTKTVEFMREWSRMCEGRSCEKCPISPHSVAARTSCHRYVASHPDEAIAIVQKWSDEHPVINPVMTWAGKLRELLPNANLVALSDLVAQMRGVQICPVDVFGADAPCWRNGCDWKCSECWNGEYKEE